MAGEVRVAVDRRLCMGSGVCVEFAPGTFAHDEQSKAVARIPVGDPLDTLDAAVESCPMGALSVVPDEAGA